MHQDHEKGRNGQALFVFEEEVDSRHIPMEKKQENPYMMAPENIYQELVKAKDNHISDLRNVLILFQERINVLESDRTSMENRLKLLPAPPEDVSSKLKEADEAKKTLTEAKGLMLEQEALIKSVSEEKHILEYELQKVESEKESLEATFSELQEAHENVKKELDEAQSQNAQLKSSQAALSGQLEQTQPSEVDFDTIKKIGKLEAIVKKLQSNLNEKVQIIENSNQKFATVQSSIMKAEEEKKAAQEELESAKKTQEELAAQKEKLEKEIAGLNSELQQKDGELSRKEREKIELETALKMQMHEERVRLQKEKDELAAKLENIKKPWWKRMAEGLKKPV
jgi:chromosome segregation ATPase